MRKSTLAPSYVALYPGLSEIARTLGYSLAIHGSVQTDMDLVAIPWTAEAVSAEELIARFISHLAMLPPYASGASEAELKPHGRRAWLIDLGYGAVLDISVMPRS